MICIWPLWNGRMSGSNKLKHSEPNLHQTSSLNACKSCLLTILSTSNRAKDAKTLYVFFIFLYVFESCHCFAPFFCVQSQPLLRTIWKSCLFKKAFDSVPKVCKNFRENMPLRSYRFVETKKKQDSNIHFIIYTEFHIAKSGSKRSFPYWNSGMTGMISFLLPSLIPSINRKTFGKQKTRVDFKNQ